MKPQNLQPQHIWHGGDYYPEQWDESVWLEDARLMKQAHWNIASIGVFGWASLQKDEDVWDFAWLDRIFDILHAHEIGISLATATASLPAWLPEKYPEVPAQSMRKASASSTADDTFFVLIRQRFGVFHRNGAPFSRTIRQTSSAENLARQQRIRRQRHRRALLLPAVRQGVSRLVARAL
jgi:hypothetical protein